MTRRPSPLLTPNHNRRNTQERFERVEGQLKEILQRLGQINKPSPQRAEAPYLRPRTQSELNSINGQNNQSANSLHFAYPNENPLSTRVKLSAKSLIQSNPQTNKNIGAFSDD